MKPCVRIAALATVICLYAPTVSGKSVYSIPDFTAKLNAPLAEEGPGFDLTILFRTRTRPYFVNVPPWWTLARIILVLLVFVVAFVAVIVWNRILARRIEKRSRELLAEQIAHVTADLKTMERTRLAIELHDSLAQNLTGVALELQTVQDVVREDIEAGAAHLLTASRSLMSCREELRNCLRDLRSEALETDDINAAIRMTLDPHLGDAEAVVRFNVPRDILTDNTMHAILRMIRELVLNAIRHGHASRIRVAGAIENGRLLFSVADNGRGFDPKNRPGPREGHFGLQGIHERIKGFAGSMEIDSRPNAGAKVSVAMMLPTEDKT